MAGAATALGILAMTNLTSVPPRAGTAQEAQLRGPITPQERELIKSFGQRPQTVVVPPRLRPRRYASQIAAARNSVPNRPGLVSAGPALPGSPDSELANAQFRLSNHSSHQMKRPPRRAAGCPAKGTFCDSYRLQ